MNVQLYEALNDLQREKGISQEVLLEAIEAALVSAYKREFGSAQNVRVDMGGPTGQMKVYARKAVVTEVTDTKLEISLDDARVIDPRYQLEDIVEIEVTPRNFGRIAAQTAKQVVVQRIREAERGIIFEEFSNREGDIVGGICQRYEQRNVVVDLGKVEAILPISEQIPGGNYEHGRRVRVYVVEVRRTTKGPQVMLSRAHPGLLKRLFELEVPEIYDGVVEIKGVSREAGIRAKVAVYSRDENVDAVGACVGPKGLRVQAIVNELRGEKIDIMEWDPDSARFVANSLSPARVSAVKIEEDERVAKVVVPDNQLSLAIGKEGQNARLAAKLTGWKIDIKSETQMDDMGELWRAPEDYDDEYYEEEYDEEGYDEYSDAPEVDESSAEAVEGPDVVEEEQ